MSTTEQFLSLTSPFTRVVESLDGAAWSAPSPCEGWTARDVLEHVMTTQRQFLTERGVTFGAAPGGPENAVEGDPDGPAPADDADPAAAWTAHLIALRATLADEAVGDTAYDGWFGPTTIGESLSTFYAFDLLVHRWDIATAAGLDERFSDEELDLIDALAAGFGDGLHMEGICRPAVEVTADADRQTRVLAQLGRSAPS